MLDPLAALNWIKDLWPLGGSAIVGGGVTWITTKRKERNSVETMRHALYSELAFNYDVLRRAFGMLESEGWGGQALVENAGVAIESYLRDLHFRDYQESLKDLKTYNQIPEYHQLDVIHADIQEVIRETQAKHYTSAYLLADNLKRRIERDVLDGRLQLERLANHPDKHIGESVRAGINAARQKALPAKPERPQLPPGQ